MLLVVSHFVNLGLQSLQNKVLDSGLVVEPSEIVEVSKIAEATKSINGNDIIIKLDMS